LKKSFLIFFILLAIWASCVPAPPSSLSVHFIDVGQGDSILIDLGDKEILIDAGEYYPGVVNYIRPFVDGKLEIVIATHPHYDHIGGLIDVLQKFDVMDMWINGDQSDSQTYRDLLSLAESKNVALHTAKRGDLIQAGDLNLLVLNPAQTFFEDPNNNSIALNLRYRDVDFLFMGDAEHEAETAMLLGSNMPVPDCDVLKIGHHGSGSATSQDFLSVAKPETAVYMAGSGNSFNHPHREVIERLAANGVKIYGTDKNGNIVVNSDGKTCTVNVGRK
jgi:competence protein ComEC